MHKISQVQKTVRISISIQRGKNPPDDAIKTLENDFINGRCQWLLQIIYLDSFCQRLLKEAQRRQHVVQE